MAYLQTAYSSADHFLGFDVPQINNMPDVSRTFLLTEGDRDTVLEFLNERPVHTVAMSSFIYDNGIESPLNRGKFYGYHDRFGELEGVALIGHATLVEARSKEALSALAFVARRSSDKINLILSSGDDALDFWAEAVERQGEPRSVCREYLFEIGFPFLVRECEHDVRLATAEELEPVAQAQQRSHFLSPASTRWFATARDLWPACFAGSNKAEFSWSCGTESWCLRQTSFR